MKNKADEQEKSVSPTLEEMERLDKVKADKTEFEMIKQEFKRLEGIVERLENEFTEGEGGDFDDEFEGEEDSEVDDVKSLADGQEKKMDNEDEGDDEEPFEGDATLSKSPMVKLGDQTQQFNMTQKIEQPKDLLEEAKEKEEKDKLEIESKEKAKIEAEQKAIKDAEEKAAKERTAKAEAIKIEIDKHKEETSSKILSIANNLETKEDQKQDDQDGNDSEKLKASNSRKSSVDQQSTLKSRKRGLSRMNSKMSIATKNKGGGKRTGGGGGGADTKIVSELQLNVKKLLEDVRKLKNFEHETELALKKIEHILDDQKLK